MTTTHADPSGWAGGRRSCSIYDSQPLAGRRGSRCPEGYPSSLENSGQSIPRCLLWASDQQVQNCRCSLPSSFVHDCRQRQYHLYFLFVRSSAWRGCFGSVAFADVVAKGLFAQNISSTPGTRMASLLYASAHAFSGALVVQMIFRMSRIRVDGVCPSWEEETGYHWPRPSWVDSSAWLEGHVSRHSR